MAPRQAKRSDNEIVSTVAGLVNCAVKNGNDLIDLAGSPPRMEKLCTFLKEESIPITIGAKLYKKYVTLPQQNGKYLYIPTVLELPDGHVQAGSRYLTTFVFDMHFVTSRYAKDRANFCRVHHGRGCYQGHPKQQWHVGDGKSAHVGVWRST